ncbi:single-stranded-DNA-specific exonuclease RecJ [Brochothrix campestris]|uniref:single-stranded-DNA-specific exonuclease RecJ n=1 Tax=Brochothrix campestris TaxID=2757 RepID=UPI0004B29C44|nr:single-stranded-DNA-specific exonuclease RecJ [Brochothrix campestris]
MVRYEVELYLEGVRDVLASNYDWQELTNNQADVLALAKATQLSTPITALLWERNLRSEAAIEQFLQPTETVVHDPFLLSDMEKTLEIIEEALAEDKKIMIYGDYDADGVTSTAVLYEALQIIGAEPSCFIPNRFVEGYGPNKAAFKKIKEDGYDLLITVDNGIAGIEEMAYAREIGLQVICTDHHEVGAQLPDADAIVHPKHPAFNYPFKELAGVGVAFKVAHALLGEIPVELLDLFALGTIGDMVSLTDENRFLVKAGLERLAVTERPGLQALYRQLNLDTSTVTSDMVGFKIAPHLNAAGRLGSAEKALALLITRDVNEAKQLASDLVAINNERKAIVNELVLAADEQVQPFLADKVLIVAGKDWHEGVLGIVASRLVEAYQRPVIVLSLNEEKQWAKGSGRSIPGLNLYDALNDSTTLLTRFGGHAGAAGLTLPIDNVAALRTAVNTYAAPLLAETSTKLPLMIDLNLTIPEASLALLDEVKRLEPFGTDNPKPLVKFTNVRLASIRQIGADNAHLKATFKDDEATIEAIGFNIGALKNTLNMSDDIDVVGELSLNEWRNQQMVQLQIKDIAVTNNQLFDLRGEAEWSKFCKTVTPFNQPDAFVVFNHPAFVSEWADKVNVLNLAVDELPSERINSLVIVDLPTDAEQLEALLAVTQPQNIYARLENPNPQGLVVLPSREEFGDFFKFIAQFQPVDVKRQHQAICQKLNISKNKLFFMTTVFFELEFVKIEKDCLTINEQAPKHQLAESASYKKREAIEALQQRFIYSNYTALYNVFWSES